MNRLESLREIYAYDPQTRTFTIPIRLGSYDDFFNPLDPSPAPARDLSPELVDYLNQCSDEIPDNYPVDITLQVQKEPGSPQREAECLASLRTFYHHESFVTLAQMRRQRGRALKYLLVSVACLVVYILSGQWQAPPFLWDVLREAVLIGGWLFMWEAVTLNFIETDDHRQQIRKYERLIKARITFEYDR